MESVRARWRCPGRSPPPVPASWAAARPAARRPEAPDIGELGIISGKARAPARPDRARRRARGRPEWRLAWSSGSDSCRRPGSPAAAGGERGLRNTDSPRRWVSARLEPRRSAACSSTRAPRPVEVRSSVAAASSVAAKGSGPPRPVGRLAQRGTARRGPPVGHEHQSGVQPAAEGLAGIGARVKTITDAAGWR